MSQNSHAFGLEHPPPLRTFHPETSRFRSEKGFLSVTMLPKEQYLVSIG